PGSERDLRTDDAMAAVETFLGGEHMHRAALALGVAAAPAGQFRHDSLGVHAAGEHMAVIAISGDNLVAGLERHLHANDHGFLPDIKVAESADQPHAVELPGLLLEAADQQHVAECRKILFLGEFGHGCALARRTVGGAALGLSCWFVGSDSHVAPQETAGPKSGICPTSPCLKTATAETPGAPGRGVAAVGKSL